jgi:hypothetical protein
MFNWKLCDDFCINCCLFVNAKQEGKSVYNAVADADVKMKLPGVLIIGKQFFVKVEDIAIHMESVACMDSAVGLLIAYYFILDTVYPVALINVFSFLQLLFNFPAEKKVKVTTPAERLWGIVGKLL